MDRSSIGDEWNSGETLAVILVDQDLNKNTLSDEDMTLVNHASTIPSLQIGSPITLDTDSHFGAATMTVGTFNKIGVIATADSSSYTGGVLVNFTKTVADYRTAATAAEYVFVNYDVSNVVDTVTGIALEDAGGYILLGSESTAALTTNTKGLLLLDNVITASGTATLVESDALSINFTAATSVVTAAVDDTLYVDIFTFGDKTDYDRQNNAIYRFLLEETGDNTATFIGDVEFVMLNQLNTDTSTVFSSITTISDSIDIIVHEDLTDEDSPRVNYLDLGADGVSTQIADQVAAPSHSGVVSFDNDNNKTAETVVVTINDQDKNTDSE